MTLILGPIFISVWLVLRKSSPSCEAVRAAVRDVGASQEAAARVPVNSSAANLPAVVTPGPALPEVPQVPPLTEGKREAVAQEQAHLDGTWGLCYKLNRSVNYCDN